MKKLNLKESVETISNHTGMNMENLYTDWNKLLEVYRIVKNNSFGYRINIDQFIDENDMKGLVMFIANNIISKINNQNKVSEKYTTELNTTAKDIVNGTIHFNESNSNELIKELNQIDLTKLTKNQIENVIKFIECMNDEDIQDYILCVVDNENQIHDLETVTYEEFLSRFESHLEVIFNNDRLEEEEEIELLKVPY